ncbi:hypothetical protein EG863_15555, partial [Enterococcus faecalis]
ADGRVRYGGAGDSREGLWDEDDVRQAAARYRAAAGPVPVFIPEMGDSRKQHEALVRLIYSGAAGEAMSWLQNPRMQAPDQRFNQFCQRRVHAPHGHGSFITGSVTPPLPHIGDA